MRPMSPTRAFLRACNRRVRDRRPPVAEVFQVRSEPDAVPPFAIVWFATRGCSFDRAGDCLACNYGRGTAPPDPVELVGRALECFAPPPGATLMISPSGSMFDETEVPGPARERIFSLAAATDCARFGCETRVEFLDEPKLAAFAAILGGKETFLELGVESADPFVLKYCINKAGSAERYRRALAAMAGHGIAAVANVSLGAPFLTPRQAVGDALGSVRWALAQGFAQVVLFPLHVKRATLLQWLWQRGLYRPPSLWRLVEVLTHLAPEERSRVTVGWYDVSQEPDASRRLLLASPDACPGCRSTLLAAIDRFAKTGEDLELMALAGRDCACRVPGERFGRTSLVERVLTAYRAMGHDLLGDRAWVAASGPISRELRGDGEGRDALDD